MRKHLYAALTLGTASLLALSACGGSSSSGSGDTGSSGEATTKARSA